MEVRNDVEKIGTGGTGPAYGSIKLTLNNVLVPADKLSPTPSSLDGLDHETETDLRIMGCELIQTSGILLALPQTAMATAQVLFQRFYYSKSFVRQPMDTTAMACVYLASKIEEAPRRIRDVVNVFHHIRQYRTTKIIQPMILDPNYIRQKNDVTLSERRILKELGFCVHVKHPHKLIVVYMQQLGYDRDSKFVQMSWNFMNDALRTNVFVRFTPESIACACIYLSARLMKIPLPNLPGWYTIFDVPEEDMKEISITIMELYERPVVNVEQLESTVDVLVKAYQEARQKNKPGSSTQKDTSITASPTSKPASPQIVHAEDPLALKKNSVANSEKSVDVVSVQKELDTFKRTEDMNGSITTLGVQNHSPTSRKVRRSHSPIVYDESPGRHKHKRKKISRYSSSRSRSRSRDRRSTKKVIYRDRKSSPYSPRERHHKKRTHHTRYSTSRSSSRSRERARRSDNKRPRRREKSQSPYSPSPRKHKKKSHSQLESWVR